MTTVNSFYKFLTPFLIVIFAVNSGHGFYAPDNSPISMELCDHSDYGTEGEEKENGETDDIFKHDHKAFSLNTGNTTDSENFSILGMTPEHLETPTPPPEFL